MRWMSLGVAVAAWILSTSISRSQSVGIDIDVALEEKTFLPGEELPVGIRITNLSGRPVTFGTTSNWLSFYLESKTGDAVTRLGQVPVGGEFSLESAKIGTKWWNIQPYFDIEGPGTYLVYAEVKLPEWNQKLISDPVSISIEPTRNLWDISFGVPPPQGGSSVEPEIRRYALLAATRGKERKLFARVADEDESRIYKVVLLDRLLSFAKPEQQLDNASRLHVLFQTGGNAYTYCVLDHDGNLVVRQRHDIAPGSRPRLAKADDGSIGVRGGVRFPTAADVPPYIPPPPVVNTNAVAIDPTKAGTSPKKTRAQQREEKRLQREKQK